MGIVVSAATGGRRMEHREGTFRSGRGHRIFHQCWLPDGPPRAVLVVAHGVVEHSGRYANVVDHFVSRGYAVYTNDHVGHGKSGGRRAHVRRFADYVDTLSLLIDMVIDRQPTLPIFLVGHSMGALMCCHYLLESQELVSGVVLSAPSVILPTNVPGGLILLGRMLSVLAPACGLVTLRSEGISRDPAVVAAYSSDPLMSTRRITARLAAEIQRAMKHIQACASRITVPLLILQGSADTVVDPAGAQKLYATVSSSDRTMDVYEGFYHEVLNDTGHEQVLIDMEHWLEYRLD